MILLMSLDIIESIFLDKSLALNKGKKRPNAEACSRNREVISEVLKFEFSNYLKVLEIGSGTGQHAVFFAKCLPKITWQTSDLPCNHKGINDWIKYSGHSNVKPPINLDVERDKTVIGRYDAVFSSNTAHIMNIKAVELMFSLVGVILSRNNKFCLYGPFKINGNFNSESNEKFNNLLFDQNSAMGIRDLEDLDGFAKTSKLTRTALYAMPANNYTVVYTKT